MLVLGVSYCPSIGLRQFAPVYVCTFFMVLRWLFSTVPVSAMDAFSHHVARPDSMGEFGQARQALPVGCRSNTTANTYQTAKCRWIKDTT
jgi:hypothetical protein